MIIRGISIYRTRDYYVFYSICHIIVKLLTVAGAIVISMYTVPI